MVALAFALPLLLVSCDKQLEFEPGDVILAEDAIQTPDDSSGCSTPTMTFLPTS